MSALAGTVTGSVMAFKTNNPKYLWVSAGLPVAALLSMIARDRARAEAQREQMSGMVQALRKELELVRASAVPSRNLAADMQSLVRYMDASRASVRGLEAKLAVLEDAVVSAARSAGEAAAASSRMRQETQGSLDGMIGALRREIAQELRSSAGNSDTVALLSRLESRLVSLEGAMGNLEQSQLDALRRLSASLGAAMSDAMARSLPAPAAAPSPALIPGTEVEVELTERERARLREIVKDEVQRGVGQVLYGQEQALKELATQPLLLDPDQWSALGNRLRSIEKVISEVRCTRRSLLPTVLTVRYARGDPSVFPMQIPNEQRALMESWGEKKTLDDLKAAVSEALEALKGPSGPTAVETSMTEVLRQLSELREADQARASLLSEALRAVKESEPAVGEEKAEAPPLRDQDQAGASSRDQLAFRSWAQPEERVLQASPVTAESQGKTLQSFEASAPGVVGVASEARLEGSPSAPSFPAAPAEEADVAMKGEGTVSQDPLSDEVASDLLQRGLECLKRGREESQLNPESAEALLRTAEECFSTVTQVCMQRLFNC